MYLKKLNLINFKNFDNREFEFSSHINCFVGNNGVGKTNVLDAVYYLSFCKSYFNPVDKQNIRHGEQFFMLNGSYEKAGAEDLVAIGVQKGEKKTVKRNDKVYARISDFIGYYPLVIISPYDSDLIIEGSSVRRKFIDGVISQLDKQYLQDHLQYTRLLSHRNVLLKNFAAQKHFEPLQLEVYDEQLIELGQRIYSARKSFLEEFIPAFQEMYARISGGSEEVDIHYKSHFEADDVAAVYHTAREKDRILQYTTVGTHKDDIQFKLNGYPVKKFGSQGQQKSFLIAMKLAQFMFMNHRTGEKPILLLDDIFDKLDEERVKRIIALVKESLFGQIFISDTHAERTEELVKQLADDYKLYKLG